MSNLLVTCFAITLLALAVGCQNKDEKSMSSTTQQSMKGMDQCSHCAGVQTAKADGTCPGCGAMLTKSNAK